MRATEITIQLPRGFVLHLAGCDDSYYTIAEIVPPLPVEIAARLADATHPQFPLREGVLSARVGEVIRAHGLGSGLSGEELTEYGESSVGPGQVGVAASGGRGGGWRGERVRAGPRDRASADVIHRTRYMESLLLVCEQGVPLMIKRMVVDGEVDRKVVASDPRWVALKARFRTEIGAVA
jgi:hypothetical protein